MPHSPSAEDIRLTQTIWDYMFIKDDLQKSDIIIGLGGHDMHVVDDVVSLYKRGLAPIVVFAGNVGRTTHGLFTASEAAEMKQRAINQGLDTSIILTEERSTNTGENLQFSQQLIREKGIYPNKVLLVHSPYMLMRDRAIFMKQWKGADTVKLRCWAQEVTLQDYLARSTSASEEISIIVGDLERLKTYYDYGFQTEQPIPPAIWQSFEQLVARGYDSHLVRHVA